MTLKVYRELEQGSDEWLQARCGIVTASVVGKLITPTRKVADNETSRGLTMTLAAERITGHVDDTYVSPDMMRGTLEEPFARQAYADHYGEVEQVGFMTEDRFGFTIGASPDGLVGTEGGIEIKSRRAKTHVEIILAGRVPDRHMAQIQTCLLVSGREWWDYVDYSNGMHLYVKRVEADTKWFTAILDAAQQFEENVADIVNQYDAATANLPKTERIPDIYDEEIVI